jgi:hypothetical protein
MEPKIASDLLWGVEAIAKEIGMPVRKVYWQLERGTLPAGKIGNTWVGSRQTLGRHLQELTSTMKPRGKTGVYSPNRKLTTRKTRMKKAVSA